MIGHPTPETRGLTLNWLAPWYNALCTHIGLGHDFRARIVEVGDIRSGDHVLDAGCATGALTCLVAHAVGATESAKPPRQDTAWPA